MKIIGSSRVSQELKSHLLQAAGSSSNVLLTGETGSGKELAAKFIHENSVRSHGPFVAINCSAIPEALIESEFFGHEKGAFTGAERSRAGLFERAHKGILFLDEIGEMDLRLQPKILRALQERKIRRVGGSEEISIDVRLVCATHRDLIKEVEQGRFREDLFYRLNVLPISVAPLRERKEDIPELIHHFVAELQGNRRIHTIQESYVKALQNYHFKGNIRELHNIVERSIIYATDGTLSIATLPADIWLTPHLSLVKEPEEKASVEEDLDQVFQENALSEMVDHYEHELISRVLSLYEGNVEKTSRRLKVSRSTLYSKMAKFGIK